MDGRGESFWNRRVKACISISALLHRGSDIHTFNDNRMTSNGDAHSGISEMKCLYSIS
jgi:hypothetical protein